MIVSNPIFHAVLKKSAEGLQEGQAQRAIQDISLFTAIQKVIESLLRMAGDVDSDDSDEEDEGEKRRAGLVKRWFLELLDSQILTLNICLTLQPPSFLTS